MKSLKNNRMSYQLPFKKNLQEVQLAINAAIEAGKTVMKIYQHNFSTKLKQGANVEILGPGIVLDKTGSPKKTNSSNDMFFFSYSPLLCNQAIFGYGLEKLNAKKIALVINTGGGKRAYRVQDSTSLRRATLINKVPYCTNMSTAYACLEGIKSLKSKKINVKAIQEL